MIVRILHLFVVVCAYLVAVSYVTYRMLQAFPGKKRWGKAACWLGVVMSVFFIIVLCLRLFNLRSWYLPFQTVAYIWMIFVLYAFLLTLLFSFFRIIIWRIPPLRVRFARHLQGYRRGYALFSFILICGLIIYGLYHFTQPKTVEMTLEVDKPVPDWKIVAVSDLHLGTMSSEQLNRHIDTINAMHPDMVLLLGDQFVINWRDFSPMGYTNAFRRLHPPLGVYAIHGNHEAYHEISYNEDPRVRQAFKMMNIKMLDDTGIVVRNALTLVGRADSSRIYPRKSLQELTENLPDSLPIILLDHRPECFAEAQACGVDVQLSGHTHNGQVFPMNLLQWCKSLFNGKLYHGYRKEGDTHFYVTSGLGSSGAPIRIGTTGEIVVIHLKQKGTAE